MSNKPRPISGNLPFDAIAKDYNRYCDRIVGNAGVLINGLGPELIDSFNNGTTSPLSTLVTSGQDISSGIATVAATGCASNTSFAVEAGKKYKLTIPTLIINAFTGTGLRILIAAGVGGNAGVRSDQMFYTSSEADVEHIFTATVTDATSHLQIGVAGASTVDFSGIGYSLKEVI